MRSRAQKLRIVNSLAGGADLLLPLAGGTTIAVRYYDQQRMQRLESISSKTDDDTDDVCDANENIAASVTALQHQDFDGISSFQNAFQHSVVIFIQSQDQLGQQLQQTDSIFSKLQSSLTLSSSLPSTTNNNKSKQSIGCAKIFIVPDYHLLLSTVLSIQESLSPSKIKLKLDFFHNEASRQLIPDGYTHENDIGNDIGNDGNDYQSKIIVNANANANANLNAPSLSLQPMLVKQIVRKVFQEWAVKRGIDVHDANVVLDTMGCLESISKSGWSQKDGLDSVPVEQNVKDLIRDFFGDSSGAGNGNGMSNGKDSNYSAKVDGRLLGDGDNVGNQSQHRDVPPNSCFGKKLWNGNNQNHIGRYAGYSVGVTNLDGSMKHVNLEGYHNSQHQEHRQYHEGNGQFVCDAGDDLEYFTSFAGGTPLEVNHPLHDHRYENRSRHQLASRGQGQMGDSGARRQQMQMQMAHSTPQNSDLQLPMSMQSDCSDDPRMRNDGLRQNGHTPRQHPPNYFYSSTPSLTPTSVSCYTPAMQSMTPRHQNMEMRRQTPLQMQYNQISNDNRGTSFRTPLYSSYMNMQQSARSVRQRNNKQGRFINRENSMDVCTTNSTRHHHEVGRIRGDLQEDVPSNPFQVFNY